MQHPETVTVAGKDGKPIIVNKADYDASPDGYGKLMDAETTAKGKGAAITRDEATTNVEPPAMLAGNPLNPVGQPEGQVTAPTVVQKGDKYFVVDDKGEHDTRFNEKGYKTDVEAWTAVAKIAEPQSKAV